MTLKNQNLKPHTKRLISLCLVTILIGIMSGLIGTLMAILLKAIQHISYGLDPFDVVSNESFLQIVFHVSPLRRLAVLCTCGVIAAAGWWAIHRYGQALVSISTAVQKNSRMPVLTTICHGLLQIITIGMGAPLGRERAPREVGVVFAQWLSKKAGLSSRDTKIMVACGAGAAFAAIYNVPLAGGMYVLETLLFTIEWSVIIPALASSAIAVLISWIGLGNVLQYHTVYHHLSHSLLLWVSLSGPIFGISAYWFIRITDQASKAAPKDWPQPLLTVMNYLMIGLFAMIFPVLLGNGKSPVQLEFNNAIGVGLSFTLLVLRVLITYTSLRTGSYGGLLTPSLANGALLGAVLGGFWDYFWPVSQFNYYAIIGATAFLAAAQKMPITAIILIFEFMHMKLNFLMPILIAVIGSVSCHRLCCRLFDKPN